MENMSIDLLQYLGVICGLVGAILVGGASTRSRRRGFALWILSNACLITWSVALGAWGLLAMYVVYSATSLWGWRNNADPTPATAG